MWIYPTWILKRGDGAHMSDTEGLSLLTPASFHILLALAARELYGYAIQHEIAEMTQGRLRLGPGTLYRTLNQLLAAGWVEEAGDHMPDSPRREQRRYYRLTNAGREVARAEAQRLALLAQQAQARGLLAEGWAGGGAGAPPPKLAGGLP